MVRTAVLIDFDSGSRTDIPAAPEFGQQAVVGRQPLRPFGITWIDSCVFIANHRQLLRFDARFKFRGMANIKLPFNTHQLVAHEGEVWAVSPWTNSLIRVDTEGHHTELDLLRFRVTPYVERTGSEIDDRCHFNSALFHHGVVYIAAHAFGPGSFVASVDVATWKLQAVELRAGSMIHGLAAEDSSLWWLSSGTGEIRSREGVVTAVERPGFLRGFAMTKDYFVVGVSETRARSLRHVGGSWIQLISRASGRLVEEVFVDASGSVNDLRVLDDEDFAHHNSRFPVEPVQPAALA